MASLRRLRIGVWPPSLACRTFPVRIPSVNFQGAEYQGGTIASMGAGYSDRSSNGSYIYQDDLTWIRGRHSVRFGYEYKSYFYNDRSLSDAGAFTFSPLQTGLAASAAGANVDVNNGTGNAFASFLLGAAKSATHSIVGLSSGFRQPQHAFYASDDWKTDAKTHDEHWLPLGDHSSTL